MGRTLKQNSTNLLACFFSKCEAAFHFLELQHHYRFSKGLLLYQQGRQIIVPYNDQAVEWESFAVARYDVGNQFIEILYDGANFVIESYLYIDRIHRLSFSDILQATKNNHVPMSNDECVTQKSQIERTIHDVSTALKKNKRHFLRPDPRIIDRALSMRAIRMEHSIRAQYKHDMDNASTFAAKAFLNKDFRHVIEILRPYETHLSAADQKKLKISCKRLFS